MKWHGYVLAVALSVFGLLAACGGDEERTPPPTQARSKVPTAPLAATAPPLVTTPTSGQTPQPVPTPGRPPSPVRAPSPAATAAPATPTPTQVPSAQTPVQATPRPQVSAQSVTCPLDGHQGPADIPARLPAPATDLSANETRIIVDGKAADWAGRAVVSTDPVGDA